MVVSTACQRQGLGVGALGMQVASALPVGTGAHRYTAFAAGNFVCEAEASLSVRPKPALWRPGLTPDTACSRWTEPSDLTLMQTGRRVAPHLLLLTGLTAWPGDGAQDMPALHTHQSPETAFMTLTGRQQGSPSCQRTPGHGAGSWPLIRPSRAPLVPELVFPDSPGFTLDALDLELPPSAAHREHSPPLHIRAPGCSMGSSGLAAGSSLPAA